MYGFNDDLKRILEHGFKENLGVYQGALNLFNVKT